ncbi:MAG: glycosyl transferase [Oceanospirillaceae bacterium]|nr:glycosyl transferase [Oceanospirillaceae bacterium]MBT13408.1 glycosyl transferase [Oceanospirillaceae bacterium]|tara:strand:+ start:7968 stop:8861 length:894 start_codon:yes stop_codon:yes gene_type:complete
MANIVIGIATCGRPQILAEALAYMVNQTRMPDVIYLSPINAAKDIKLTGLPDAILQRVKVLAGPAGSSAQRNTIINALSYDDIVQFLDDDFLMHPTYCEQVLALFERNPEVGGHSGKVLADGVNSGGIDIADAITILEGAKLPDEPIHWHHGTTYGCNMAFRASVLLDNHVRFDEQLPLYGWFEDLDFSASVDRFAPVVNSNYCLGVHLGTKAGRSPGLRLGYSQVVNPWYLAKKGTMPWKLAVISILRRVIANTVRSIKPEPWVDRLGRLKGNLLGIKDLLTGKAHPARILEFSRK